MHVYLKSRERKEERLHQDKKQKLCSFWDNNHRRQKERRGGQVLFSVENGKDHTVTFPGRLGKGRC